MKTDEILGILDKHEGDRGGLISILEEIQAEYSYLPDEALKIVAKETGRSLVDIYGVATFYKSFSLKPRGKHLCSVCVGTEHRRSRASSSVNWESRPVRQPRTGSSHWRR